MLLAICIIIIIYLFIYFLIIDLTQKIYEKDEKIFEEEKKKKEKWKWLNLNKILILIKFSEYIPTKIRRTSSSDILEETNRTEKGKRKERK